jgi:hypothetical protein
MIETMLQIPLQFAGVQLLRFLDLATVRHFSLLAAWRFSGWRRAVMVSMTGSPHCTAAVILSERTGSSNRMGFLPLYKK